MVTVLIDARSLARRTLVLLMAANGTLVALDVALNRSQVVPYRAFRRLFNVAVDNSISGWFASSLSLAAALLAAGVGVLKRRAGSARESSGWFLVGGLFLYLAADDGAKIHERIGTTFDRIAASGHWTIIESYPSYTWQITVGPLLGIAGLLAVLFLWRRFDAPDHRRLFAGAVACFIGAVGLDVVEGVEYFHQWIASAVTLADSSVRHYLKVLEEFLEMSGMSIVVTLFLARFLKDLDGVLFRTRPEH